jgi:hypothetical protein
LPIGAKPLKVVVESSVSIKEDKRSNISIPKQKQNDIK